MCVCQLHSVRGPTGDRSLQPPFQWPPRQIKTGQKRKKATGKKKKKLINKQKWKKIGTIGLHDLEASKPNQTCSISVWSYA